MLQTRPGASLHTFHVQRKLIRDFWRLGKELEEGSICPCGYIESSLSWLVGSAPLLSCLYKSRRGGHRKLGHEIDPVRKSRVGNEEARDRVVGNALRIRLRQKIAGHCHTHNALQLGFGHTRLCSEIGIGNATVEGDRGGYLEMR